MTQVSVMGLCEWTAISITYIGFRRACRAQGITRSSLPYTHPFAYVGAWICIVAFSGRSSQSSLADAA